MNHREWKFAASQKACFLTVNRNQVWLSQDLQQVLLLQGLHHRPEIEVCAEQEKVERII